MLDIDSTAAEAIDELTTATGVGHQGGLRIAAATDTHVLHGGKAAYREFVLKRRLWRFGLAPDEVEDFLAPYGWDEVEQVGPAQYATRYLEPAGRPLPVSEIERCVLAVKG